MTKPDGLREEERLELLLRAYLDVQGEQEVKGVLPRSGENVLTRLRGAFEFVGALQLGLLVACMSILLDFIIVVMIFHLDVARYSSFLFPL